MEQLEKAKESWGWGTTHSNNRYWPLLSPADTSRSTLQFNCHFLIESDESAPLSLRLPDPHSFFDSLYKDRQLSYLMHDARGSSGSLSSENSSDSLPAPTPELFEDPNLPEFFLHSEGLSGKGEWWTAS